MSVATGADTRVNLQYESSYNTLDSNRSPFVPGANGSLDTAEVANNIVRITNFGSDTAVALEESAFEGAFALSWTLTNPWWLEGIFGAPSTTDNGDGTYTHTYSLGDPQSFQLIEGYDLSTDAERVLTGCVPRSVTIEDSVDDGSGARVSMDGFYANENTGTGISLTAQDTLDADVLDFADCTLKRDGSTEAITQSATLGLGWETAEPIREFGSRTPTHYVNGLFAPTLNYEKIKTDVATLQDAYGGASATAVQEDLENTISAELSWDNDVAAGSGLNRHVYSLSSTLPDSYGESGVGDPASAIREQLNRVATDVTVDVTNETASPP